MCDGNFRGKKLFRIICVTVISLWSTVSNCWSKKFEKTVRDWFQYIGESLVANPGCFIPDPESRIPDPISIDKFLTQKTDNQLLKNKIGDVHPGSRIPDPGSWLWIFFYLGPRSQKSTGSGSSALISKSPCPLLWPVTDKTTYPVVCFPVVRIMRRIKTHLEICSE